MEIGYYLLMAIFYAIMTGVVLVFSAPTIAIIAWICIRVNRLIKSSTWWELRQVEKHTKKTARKMEAVYRQVSIDIDQARREHRKKPTP